MALSRSTFNNFIFHLRRPHERVQLWKILALGSHFLLRPPVESSSVLNWTSSLRARGQQCSQWSQQKLPSCCWKGICRGRCVDFFFLALSHIATQYWIKIRTTHTTVELVLFFFSMTVDIQCYYSFRCTE